jgi:uroporphyrinogen-III synthase
MAVRVLVTRPEPGAAATASRLAAAGFEPVVLPLTGTRPLEPAEAADADAFDAVVATSGAALRHAPPELLRRLCHLPLFAVGERTAEAARAAGFAQATSAGGDSLTLAGHVARSLPAGSRLAYLCGRVRTGSLAERLRREGFAVTVVETYDTLPVERSGEEVAEALSGRPVDAVLLYSANVAVLFARLLAARETGPLLRQARLLCISRRTAQALPQPAQDRAEIAATPDEAALLALFGDAK